MLWLSGGSPGSSMASPAMSAYGDTLSDAGISDSGSVRCLPKAALFHDLYLVVIVLDCGESLYWLYPFLARSLQLIGEP